MTDVLAALNQLEEGHHTKRKGRLSSVEENTRRNARINNAAAAPKRNVSIHSVRSTKSTTAGGKRPPAPLQRPISYPSQPDRGPLQIQQTPSRPTSAYSPSLRKISFANELPRPVLPRMRIPTKTDALPSGFPYDTRLFKFGVTQEEWNDFSSCIIEAADVPTITHVPILAWTWSFHKSKVIKGAKKQMLYESSKLMREIKRWNKLFRRQGFQVTLELPGQNTKMGDGWETEEEKKQLRLIAKRFRVLITPNAEKGARPVSIYSRNSSLTKAISGEGAATTITRVPTIEISTAEADEEDDGNENGAEGDGSGEEKDSKGNEFSDFEYSAPEQGEENGNLSPANTSPPNLSPTPTQSLQERPLSPQPAVKKKKASFAEPPSPDNNAGIPFVVQQMLARAAAQKEKEMNGF
ncbi:hypothetical protein HYFRA_00000459 [Hymenoscyphus fraxineus]|uniref:Uncharacterized protein n=1 Tax=Hymenoscyphus fraxineus TaxID=746836 RepID=A0A9N9L4Q3_9HELO|nr:hypothetical protein HYFRA_00000459 [Hymenoscyphus fraxineus]